MKKLGTIYVDCDGPLADFSAGFLALVEEETGFAFGTACVTEWSITKSPFFVQLAADLGVDAGALAGKVWAKTKRIGFCSSLPLVAGAKEAIGELREIAEHVEVVTSPLAGSATWMAERTEWLHRTLGFHDHDVHFSHRKYRFRGDLLVDDKTSHCVEFAAAGTDCAVLFGAPYNRADEPVEPVRMNDSGQIIGGSRRHEKYGTIVRADTWEQAVAYAKNLREMRDDDAPGPGGKWVPF